MTRLFFRFYLGVIVILFGAWMLQAFAFRYFSPPENKRVFEEMIGGGIRMARELYLESGSSLEAIERHLVYPARVVPLSTLPEEAQRRLSSASDVAAFSDDGIYSAALLPGGTDVLRFGPMPTPRGPSERALLGILALLLALVGGAIALLLRPLTRQLRLLEATATSIAGGDFSARVDERRVASVRLLARAMNDMGERTESLLRSQREMLQAVSHELRTPLARIGFAIDLLRSDQKEEQRAARLDSLEAAALELDNLVSELLHYVRWEDRELPTQDEAVELLPLVEGVIDKHAAFQPAKYFSLGENLRRGDVVIRGDRRAFERAIGNLVANASRFAKRRVVVDCRRGAEATEIYVDDDGPGISPPDRERIFEPFVRLDDSGRGAGLGLSLVKRIVQHYRGEVAAGESPLGGCRIAVTLPGKNGAADTL